MKLLLILFIAFVTVVCNGHAVPQGNVTPTTGCDPSTATYPITGHVYSHSMFGLRAARVVATMDGAYTYAAYANTFGEYSLMVPPCGQFSVTAQLRGYSFPSYTFTLPDDQFTGGRTLDIVAN